MLLDWTAQRVAARCPYHLSGRPRNFVLGNSRRLRQKGVVMKNRSGTINLLLLLAVALTCIFAHQACNHFPPPVHTPFVVDFQEPIPIKDFDETKLIAALEKHAVRTGSKIKIDGELFWPTVGSIKTDRVAASKKKEGGVAFAARGRATQRLNFKTAADMEAFMEEISKK